MEELQTVADPQHILTRQGLLLGPVGGQPLPDGQLHQVGGGAGQGHLQTGRVLAVRTRSETERAEAVR